jgi:hypothetical protein
LCDYVILSGWAPDLNTVWQELEFAVTANAAVVAGAAAFGRNVDWFDGFYTGVSIESGGKVRYQTPDGKVLTSNFQSVEGLIPENTEIIVKGALPCL